MPGGLTASGSLIQVDASIGGALADFVEVVRASERHARSSLVRRVVGRKSQNVRHGVYGGEFVLEVLWKRSDHNVVRTALATPDSYLTLKIQPDGADATDANSGEALVVDYANEIKGDDYCTATVTLVSDGAWTLGGTSTST